MIRQRSHLVNIRVILNSDGLAALSDSAAKSLSKHKGYLGLDGLAALSDSAAKSLSKYKGRLSFNGLTALSDSAAESPVNIRVA